MSRGGHPGLSVLTSLLVSMDVKLYCTIYCTMLWHWSQLVPNEPFCTCTENQAGQCSLNSMVQELGKNEVTHKGMVSCCASCWAIFQQQDTQDFQGQV